MRTPTTFVQRVADSTWAGADARLVDAITETHVEVGPDQRGLADRAVLLAQPGLVEPRRLLRHATAASVSRALRLATGLPAAVSSRRPLNDPAGWARDVIVEAFVDQLALGGPASAELARQIANGGELFPPIVRAELARREIRAVDLLPETAQMVVAGALTPTNGHGRGRAPAVHLVRPTPVTGTPVSSLYPAISDDDAVAVRVLRPRIAQDLVSDSRLAAGAAAVLERAAPDAGGLGPRSFVRLVLRQNLEAVDLRFEALNLVELGLILEELDRPGIVVARPRAGLITPTALGIDPLGGTPLRARAKPALDGAAVVAALVGVTIESAITHGVFWADPAPEHLLVQPDGRLALVGVGTVGRFTPELRRAGARMIKGVLTGDFGGMVEGLRAVGAIGPDADVDGLLADLAADDRIDPRRILFGGEHALLEAIRALVGIMLAHRLEPPVEVILLLRTLFATGRLVATVAPDGPGLKGALMGLLPRLPTLLAD
jgi:ubiquinone biosynthesis protein